MGLLEVLHHMAADMQKVSHRLSVDESLWEDGGTRVSGKGDVPFESDVVRRCVVALQCVRFVLLHLSCGKKRNTGTECCENNSLTWEYTDLEQLYRSITMSEENISEKSSGIILAELLKDTQSSWLSCQRMLGKLLELDSMAIQQLCTGSGSLPGEPISNKMESEDKKEERKDNRKMTPVLISADNDDDDEHWALNVSFSNFSQSSSRVFGSEVQQFYIFDDYPDSAMGFSKGQQLLLLGDADVATVTGFLTQPPCVNSGECHQFMEKVPSDQSITTDTTIPVGSMVPLKDTPLELDGKSFAELPPKLGHVSWEKRSVQVRNSSSLKSLLDTLLLEDYGWSNFRLKLQNRGAELGNSQWMAQVNVTTADGQEKVILRSPFCSRSRTAQRVAVFYTAKRFFPRELEYYATLGRSDAASLHAKEVICNQLNGETACVFQRGTDILVQVMQLLDGNNPSLAPFSWSLDALGVNMTDDGGKLGQQLVPRQFHAVLLSKFDNIMSQYTGCGNESVVSVLCNLLRPATQRLVGDKGNQLWTEYESHIPSSNIANSRELAVYMFNSFFGFEPHTNSLLTNVSSEIVRATGQLWRGKGIISTKGKSLLVSEVYAPSKRDAVNNAILLACRKNFPHMLQRIVNENHNPSALNLVNAAREILERKIACSVGEILEDTGNTN